MSKLLFKTIFSLSGKQDFKPTQKNNEAIKRRSDKHICNISYLNVLIKNKKHV